MTGRLLTVASIALGLCAPVSAQLPVDLNLDYAAFAYDSGESMLELYLSVGAASLDFEEADGQFTASLPLEIALRPASASAPDGASTDTVLSDTTTLRFTVADTAALGTGQYYVELFRTAVRPGEYELDVTVPAEGDRAEVRLILEPLVPEFETSEGARVSDITLASSIRQGEADARFYKNGLIIVPNPSGFFGQSQRRVYYYAEAYGLDTAAPDEEYTLYSYISESGRPEPSEGLQRRSARPVRSPDVLVGAFEVDSLPSGSYFLHLAFLDANNEALAEQSKRFYVFNPDIQRPTLALDESFETSLYAVMSEEEVEDNLAHARVIASQQEIAQLRQLPDLDAKRRFLAEFWRRRDTDSDLSANRARREFYERLRYADDRYATPFQEAYETDRGRVLLRFGYPSEVDPRPFDQDLLPHEIWTFENIPGTGRAIFVFADRDAMGRYDLIHSNVTGETSLPDWESQLRQ